MVLQLPQLGGFGLVLGAEELGGEAAVGVVEGIFVGVAGGDVDGEVSGWAAGERRVRGGCLGYMGRRW